MDKVIKLIKEAISQEQLVSCTLSSPRKKSNEVKSIRAIPTKNQNEIKVEYKYQKHNNIVSESTEDFLAKTLVSYLPQFKQGLLKTNEDEHQILLNKDLKAKIISKKVGQSSKATTHNRKKEYLIPDNKRCPFLIEIGVMDKNGKVKSNHYKKFRQINRFLEMVDDLFKNKEQDKFHIVDFGCGKSYLTFALYHYFTEIKQTQVKITGIDLKQEVIDHCNDIAGKLCYSTLKFAHGFIHDFKTDDPVDFVVTLHACDTATDDAILFALRHQAKDMMFVPCCQHELNKQLHNEASQVMLKHGIMRDRLTALITDTMRAQLLEFSGYKVQVMEFIDLEHTAKNILLRCSLAKRSEKQKQEIWEKYLGFKKQWGIEPYLEKKINQGP